MTQVRTINVVVTDLDNTLFDWVEVWYQSFRAMLDEVVRISGIAESVLVKEIRAIHQKYGTSEYAFLLEELPSLKELHPDGKIAEKYQTAIIAYRVARKKHLQLYPGVRETLERLQESGCVIVGYTESMAFYSGHRIRQLGLDGLLNYLYSPADHDLPENLTPEQLRMYPAEYYKFEHTVHRHTPVGELKPNPHVLREILKDIGAHESQCIYVGDSLVKDIAMAQDASVTDVYVAYGKAHERREYDLLRSVTHWPDEHVAKESAVSPRDTRPTYTLNCSFAELFALFRFRPAELPESVIAAWKMAITVQQHFNDLSMRIRNLAVTLLGALLGAAALSYREGISVDFPGGRIPMELVVLVVAFIVWVAFFLMDLFWYHRLLKGAVIHAQSIEAKYEGLHPELSLSKAIRESSPVHVGKWTINSNKKIVIFYSLGKALIIGLFVFFLCNASHVLPTPATDGPSTRPAFGKIEIRGLPQHLQSGQAPSSEGDAVPPRKKIEKESPPEGSDAP